jgi:dolichyl-phosphate-mannose--protein O-mannosyl transferase
LIGLWIQFHYDTNFLAITTQAEEKGNLLVFYVSMAVVMIIFMAILIGIFWVFYKVIYGWLLKKLSYNYEELKKIDS